MPSLLITGGATLTPAVKSSKSSQNPTSVWVLRNHTNHPPFFFFWLSKSYHRVFGSIKSFQIDLIRQTTTSLTEPSAILSWMFTFKSKVRWKMHFKWRPHSTPPSFKQNFSNGQNYGNNGRTEQIYGRSETIKITAMFEGITFSVLSYKTTESWWNWGASN